MKNNTTVFNFAKHCMKDKEFLCGGIPSNEKYYFKKLGWKEGDDNSRKFYEIMCALANLDKATSVTRTWKVYGAYGHRQRESFNKSVKYDWSNERDGIRIFEVYNYDTTGTHDYSVVRITRNTYDECEEELRGQISDGCFENSRTGKVVEII